MKKPIFLFLFLFVTQIISSQTYTCDNFNTYSANIVPVDNTSVTYENITYNCDGKLTVQIIWDTQDDGDSNTLHIDYEDITNFKLYFDFFDRGSEMFINYTSIINKSEFSQLGSGSKISLTKEYPSSFLLGKTASGLIQSMNITFFIMWILTSEVIKNHIRSLLCLKLTFL